MKIISIGHKMPKWIEEGFIDYQKRLTKPWNLELIEIPSKAYLDEYPPEKIKAIEAEWILQKLNPGDFCVALDVQGKSLSTEKLAESLQNWQSLGKNLVFVIGGREGLDECILERADCKWSLSALTFPHQLVKVILAEQLYRAVSIINHHPYHRV